MIKQPIELTDHEKKQTRYFDTIGDVFDGYHTFNELYDFRKAYNACLFNAWAQSHPMVNVVKSKRHSDGEECCGGGWFVVVAETPIGQISNHYELKDWGLFQVPEIDKAPVWDGHTPQQALYRLLALASPDVGRKAPTLGNDAPGEVALYQAPCSGCLGSVTDHYVSTGKCVVAGCGIIDPARVNEDVPQQAAKDRSHGYRHPGIIAKTFWEENFKPYKWKDEITRKIAWKLPRRLIVWCYVRVVAYATTGKYGNTVVPELGAMEALGRYEQDHSAHKKDERSN